MSHENVSGADLAFLISEVLFDPVGQLPAVTQYLDLSDRPIAIVNNYIA